MTNLGDAIKAHLSEALDTRFTTVSSVGEEYRILTPSGPIDMWQLVIDSLDEHDEDALLDALFDIEGPPILSFEWVSEGPPAWSDAVVTFDLGDRTYVALENNPDLDRPYVAIAAVEPQGNLKGLSMVAAELLVSGYEQGDWSFSSLSSAPTEWTTVVPRDDLPALVVEAFDRSGGDGWEALAEAVGQPAHPQLQRDSPAKQDLANSYLLKTLKSR